MESSSLGKGTVMYGQTCAMDFSNFDATKYRDSESCQKQKEKNEEVAQVLVVSVWAMGLRGKEMMQKKKMCLQ